MCKCDKSDKRFSSEEKLYMHTRTHLFKTCEICKKVFPTHYKLNHHRKKACKTRQQIAKSAKVISTLNAICVGTVYPTQMTSTKADCVLSLAQTAKHEDSHFAGTNNNQSAAQKRSTQQKTRQHSKVTAKK